MFAIDRIARAILFIRGEKVLLDSGLPALYGAPAKVLSWAVARNRNRYKPLTPACRDGGHTRSG